MSWQQLEGPSRGAEVAVLATLVTDCRGGVFAWGPVRRLRLKGSCFLEIHTGAHTEILSRKHKPEQQPKRRAEKIKDVTTNPTSNQALKMQHVKKINKNTLAPSHSWPQFRKEAGRYFYLSEHPGDVFLLGFTAA